MADARRRRPTIISERSLSNVRNVISIDRRSTVSELADRCDISRTTVHKILTENFGMNRVYARCVPRLLTEENKTTRVKAAKSFYTEMEYGQRQVSGLHNRHG